MPTIDNWRAMREAPGSADSEEVRALIAAGNRLAADAQNCQNLIWALARELKCLPSTFSDANGHVLKAAIALNAERDRLAEEVEALRAEVAKLTEPDMFWDGSDPEVFGHDVQEIAYEHDFGTVVKIDCARRLPSFNVRITGDGEYEPIDAARGIKEGGAV